MRGLGESCCSGAASALTLALEDGQLAWGAELTNNENAIEAAARAICRRRLIVRLAILSDAHLQETVDLTWQDFADDARVALEAADQTGRERPEGSNE